MIGDVTELLDYFNFIKIYNTFRVHFITFLLSFEFMALVLFVSAITSRRARATHLATQYSPKCMYNKAMISVAGWVSSASQRDIYYSTAIFLSVCTLPWPCYFICWFLFSECMLSICYSNSCYNSWPIGLMFYWEWVKKRRQKEKRTRQECILIKSLFSKTLMGWHWCICIEMNYTGLAWRDF